MNTQKKLLVLEDLEDMHVMFTYHLSEFDVSFVTSFAELDRSEKNHLALIADVNLPDGNFLDLILDSDFRESLKIENIIVMSGIIDRVFCKDLVKRGLISDHIAKPFDFDVLRQQLQQLID